MLVLAVTWVAQAGKEQEVLAVFSRLGAASRKEPGCRMYVVHKDRDDGRRFFVYEQYDDEAALQAHRDSAHFQEIALGLLPQIAHRAEAHLMNPVA